MTKNQTRMPFANQIPHGYPCPKQRLNAGVTRQITAKRARKLRKQGRSFYWSWDLGWYVWNRLLLQSGSVYVDGQGVRHEVQYAPLYPNHAYPYVDAEGYRYTKDGRYLLGSSRALAVYNLIRLVPKEEL